MSNKRPELQGIRGIAIIAVLLFHFYPRWFPNGYVGVDQFFVLSGFLISMILSKSDLTLTALHQFYYRRVKRIVPLYLFLLLIILLAVPICYPATTNVAINIESGWNALTFRTNIAGTSPDKTYATMVSEAEDVFTHTWSLAVEMQFYLLVPVIFFVLKNTHAGATLAIICTLSFICYFFAARDFAFNSVFARLWQFTVGIAAQQYTKSQNNPVNEKYVPLLTEVFDEEGQDGKCVPSTKSNRLRFIIVANFVLAVTICLVLSPYAFPSDIVRLFVTVFSGVIIVLSENTEMYLLSNKYLVYMGDISYALYLVHWPLYVYCKLQYPYDGTALFASLVMSILSGIILSETFEKFYLRLDKLWIFCMIIVLYICNLIVIINSQNISNLFLNTEHMNSVSNDMSGNVTGVCSQYSNLTTDEVVALNSFWYHQDLNLLSFDKCAYRVKVDGQPTGWCDIKEANETAKDTLLVLGNSYTANFMPVIHKSCKGRLKQIRQYWEKYCEPIYDTVVDNIKCAGLTEKFISAVEEMKPDHLFIIARWMDLQLPINTTNIIDDPIYKQAQTALKRMETSVVKSIVLLDSFPRPKWDVSLVVSNSIKLGKQPQKQDLMEVNPDYQAGRSRLAALASGCPKCRIIDVMPFFSQDGEFSVYEKSTGIAYYTSLLHFTPPALERIMPLIDRICVDVTS